MIVCKWWKRLISVCKDMAEKNLKPKHAKAKDKTKLHKKKGQNP